MNKNFEGTIDEIFKLHNKIRQTPKEFVPVLKERLGYFDGLLYKPPH